MSYVDTVNVGASGTLDSGVPWATCKGAPVDDDDAPDYGKTPVSWGWGFASRPYRENKEGFAVGFTVEAPGYDGVLVGGHDSRCAKTYGNLGEGCTAVFATGKDFDARAIFADRVISMMVGDDMILQIDGKKGRFVVNTPGGSIQLGSGGATIVDESGKAMVTCKGGLVNVLGNVVLGTNIPIGTVASANKVLIELGKIAAAINAIAPGSYTPPPPPAGVGVPGVYVGV